MSTRYFSPLLGAALLVLAAPVTLAQNQDDAAKPAAAVSADDKAAYPLDTCVISGEALGSMGEPFDYIHREEGKPDRLVRMCCDGCLKKFKKDPAKYLARIDAAKAEAGSKQ